MNPLDFFDFLIDGVWAGKAELKGAGEFTQEDIYERTLGGKFVRCRTKVAFADFSFESESLVGLNPADGSLAFWYFCSDGSYSEARGVLEGDTVVYSGTTDCNGPIESRFTLAKKGDDTIVCVFNGRRDGEWVRHYELKQHRCKD